MSNIGIPTFLAIAWAFSSVPAAYSQHVDNGQASVPIKQQVDAVVSHLDGAMDTSAQANAKPNASNVRITTCKVKVQDAGVFNRPDAVFLYQEQALSQRLTSPYRQRFLRIAPVVGSLIESAVFKPPTPSAWVGLCAKPELERVVNSSDLGVSSCSVFLQRSGKNYIGETPPRGCPSDYKGAVRITNRIILHQAGMDTLDRGFNAAGNQIWGAKDKPYQFRWIDSMKGKR